MSASESNGVRRDSDAPELPDGHPMWELWETMVEFYGSAFTSQYGEQPSWTWFDALKNLSTADYGVGISNLKTRDSPFPPNPGEFLALIETPEQRRQRQGTVANLIAPIPLPKEQALAQIAAIRERYEL